MTINLRDYNQDWFKKGKSNIIIILWWFIQGTFFRYSLYPMNKWRCFILRLFGARIGKNVKIRPTAKFYYPWKVEIGDNCWIGEDNYFYSLEEIILGSNVALAHSVYLNTGSHDINDKKFGLIVKPIKIENYVWIANDVFINLGVTIGEGTVVGARSTVLKSLSSWKICVGTPAKEIKERKIL